MDYAREYKALYAHVGGNIDALDSIRADGGATLTDMDQFSIGAPTYARDLSRNVPLEHTMYTTTAKLWDYAMGKKYDKVGQYDPLLFKDEAAEADRPATAQTVSINFSSSPYAVKWTYDRTTNRYLRTMAGTPHLDAETKEQIAAKNIILQTVPTAFIQSRDGKTVSKMTLTGSGKVSIYMNGTQVDGTWKRTGNGRTRYYDSTGAEISLVRGTTWVEVVHTDTPVN